MDIYLSAKQLRRNATKAERILWAKISNKKLNGYKFRSQAVIEKLYIADFCCASKKIIVEIDGSVHNNIDVKFNDGVRTKVLSEQGYHVIRFSNEDVLNNMSVVLISIMRVLEELE